MNGERNNSNNNDNNEMDEEVELTTSLLSKFNELLTDDMMKKMQKNLLQTSETYGLIIQKISIIVSLSEKARKLMGNHVEMIARKMKDLIDKQEKDVGMSSNTLGFLSNICHCNQSASEECLRILGSKELLDIGWSDNYEIKAQHANLIANITLSLKQGTTETSTESPSETLFHEFFEGDPEIEKHIEEIYRCCLIQDDVGLKYSATIALCSFAISAPGHLRNVVSREANFPRTMLEMCKMLGEFLTIQHAAGISSYETRMTLLELVKSVKQLALDSLRGQDAR